MTESQAKTAWRIWAREGSLQWARQQGAAVLRLDVAEDNEKAGTLYRRNGFASTGELAGPMPDGMRMETVMEKQLRSPASAQPVCVPDSCKQDSQP